MTSYGEQVGLVSRVATAPVCRCVQFSTVLTTLTWPSAIDVFRLAITLRHTTTMSAPSTASRRCWASSFTQVRKRCGGATFARRTRSINPPSRPVLSWDRRGPIRRRLRFHISSQPKAKPRAASPLGPVEPHHSSHRHVPCSGCGSDGHASGYHERHHQPPWVSRRAGLVAHGLAC